NFMTEIEKEGRQWVPAAILMIQPALTQKGLGFRKRRIFFVMNALAFPIMQHPAIFPGKQPQNLSLRPLVIDKYLTMLSLFRHLHSFKKLLFIRLQASARRIMIQVIGIAVNDINKPVVKIR